MTVQSSILFPGGPLPPPRYEKEGHEFKVVAKSNQLGYRLVVGSRWFPALAKTGWPISVTKGD